MKDDLICRLWQSTPAGPERDAMQMLETIRKKARAFQRTIFWRDAREIGAAALMVPICVYVAIHTRPSPLMSAGFFLTAASCLFIALWLWRSRRGAPRPAPEESVAALLRTAKYWYVLPLYASMLTIYAGIIAVSAARLAQVREQSPDRWLIGVGFLAGVFLLMTALAGLVWWLNEGYAVRKLVAARQSLAAMLPADAAPEA
jgi:uncharacterized protein involved in response to NO